MTFFKTYFSGYHKQGGIKELLIIAFPMIISMACDGIMTFTDRLFLARISSVQMNAAMGGGVSIQMLMFFFIGLTGYSTALVAQYMGAGEKPNSSKTLFQAVLIVIIAWPVILFLKPYTIMFLEYMHIPSEQMHFQIKYMNVLAWGTLFALMRHTISCYFSGIGKTPIIMIATIVAMLVNIILDYILIYGKLGFAPMGIEGAALATNIGSICAMVILIFAYFNSQNRQEFAILKSFRFDRTIMKKLLYYGYPAGLEMLLNFMAFSTMVAVFQSQGNVISTATTIMFNWDLMSFIPLIGIEIAVTSLVGRYMGGGRPQVAHRAAFSGVKVGFFYSVAVLLSFLLIPNALVMLFHPESPSDIFDAAVPIAVNMIRIAAIYVLAESLLVAYVGALRGAGDTHFTMIASVLAHWMFVPLLYVAFNVFHLSAEMGWCLLVLFFMLFCGTIVLRFNSGKWKKLNILG